jgi:hypothetical protein
MIRGLLFCIALLVVALPSLADTASGIAALNRGDYAAALAQLKPEAEKGDPAAQVKYGVMLVHGHGVARDVNAAIEWFRKSAAQNHPEGQYMLGVAYDIGDAGNIDHVTAADWYRKAAEQGYADAQFNLGDMLVKGDGIDKEPVEGAEWVRKAAEQGKANAARLYGLLCMTGVGVDQNVLAGRYWIIRAKEGGDEKAPASLEKVQAAIREIEAQGAPRTEGGDGSSPERPIRLLDAKTESEGVRAEHLVTSHYFRGWTWRGQGLITKGGLALDAIDLVRADGKKQTIYFDIGSWFGKME